MSTITNIASQPMNAANKNSIYVDGRYLDASGGSWHLEDAPFKAKCANQVVRRNNLSPRLVCEIGCGAGGVLSSLSQSWDNDTQFVGYDISPQAHELSRRFERPNVRFVLGDAFADGRHYDLALVLDVVEHVEDSFGFLRQVREKARFKLYHFPLEITCSAALRDALKTSYRLGHLHHFSQSTALATLQHTGHEIVDWTYTAVAFAHARRFRTHVANLARRLMPQALCARVLGGYSLMVLAK